MSLERPEALVLCGGRSRRMGRDKASLPFGGESLLHRLLRRVQPEVGEVVLAASRDQDVPPGFRVVRDAAPDQGPLPALLQALDTIANPYVFVTGCDCPLLQPAIIPLLARLATGWDGAVPVIGGRRAATSAVYRVAALREARVLFGDPANRSLQAYLQPLRIREVPEAVLRTADPDLLSFLPCNTPEEYAMLLRMAGLSVDGAPPQV